MKSAVVLAGFVMIVPMAWADADLPETPAQQYHALAAEYESALRARLGRPRTEKAGEGPSAPNLKAPDPRACAARFLKLAELYPDDPAAMDCLDWVLRHVRTGPEVEAALRRLGERYIQSDRMGDFSALLIGSALQGTGEALLRRILEESPHPAVREQACLSLAFYEARLANEARRLKAYKPEQRERFNRALGQARVEQVLSLDPTSLDQSADRRLRRLVDGDAKILGGEKIGGAYLSLLSNNPSPAADSILRRILETNRHRGIQDEARWALAIRQMESARLSAMIKTASTETRRQLIEDWGQDRVAQLEGIDASTRAAEIEGLLERLTDDDADKALPRFGVELISIYTRLASGAREAAYHKNAERLLRRIVESNPDRSSRGRACYSLARYQIGLAKEVSRLKLDPRGSLEYWVTRLGRDRAEQLNGFDPLQLNGDAERLLEQIVRDYADVTTPWAATPLGQQAKSALLELRGSSIGRVAPEIVGDDVEGKAMKLSDHRGKVVLLIFGCHETCAPCRAMYPYEKSLVKRLEGKPFALLGFDVDAERTKLAQAMRAEQITWRSWWAKRAGSVGGRWGVASLPTLYLIDPKGVIRARYDGFPGADTLDRAIMALLAEQEESESTASLQAKFGPQFVVGVALGGRVPDDYSPAERTLILKQFGSVTPENCMKMTAIQPREGEFHFEQADAIVEFAQQNRLQVVGHTLVWAKDERTPAWVFLDGDKPASRALVLERMQTHIRKVVSRYRGKIAAWDVVNEVLDDGEPYLRPSHWLTVCGPEFVAKAFEWAHEADPDALLVYNDYNVDIPRKREKLLRLVRELREKGARLGAVGIQGHWEVDRVPFRDIEALLDSMKQLGLKVMVSELDLGVVPRGVWWADGGAHRDEVAKTDPLAAGCPPELLERQARDYAELFRVFRSRAESIGRVTFWDLHDGRSWLNSFPWKHKEYPLLFDREGAAKPAFKAVMGVR